jgi:hypothetical protein
MTVTRGFDSVLDNFSHSPQDRFWPVVNAPAAFSLCRQGTSLRDDCAILFPYLSSPDKAILRLCYTEMKTAIKSSKNTFLLSLLIAYKAHSENHKNQPEIKDL